MKLKTLLFCSASLVMVHPATGQETRELDSHEHGHGALNIAIEGDQIAIEMEAPGFDIVGFEHAAESADDKAAVDAALKTLSDPAALFGLPDAAGCTIVEATAELHAEEEHHGEHDEDHDDHAEDEDHDDHAEADEDHAEGEDDHHDNGDDDHAEDEESHTEFHAEYLLNCTDIDQATSLELSYFKAFDNAQELEVQLVTDKGAALLEATREAPVLDLTKAM